MSNNCAKPIAEKPSEIEQKLFDLDAITCLNMMEGMKYEEAVEAAKQDLKDKGD